MLEGQVAAEQGHRQGGAANDGAAFGIRPGGVVAREGNADGGCRGAVDTGQTAVGEDACGGGLAQGGGRRLQITHKVGGTQHEEPLLLHGFPPNAAGVGASGGAIAVVEVAFLILWAIARGTVRVVLVGLNFAQRGLLQLLAGTHPLLNPGLGGFTGFFFCGVGALGRGVLDTARELGEPLRGGDFDEGTRSGLVPAGAARRVVGAGHALVGQ